MANEGIRSAIQELHGKLERQQREIVDTKKAINLLHSTIGEAPEFTDLEEAHQQHGAVRVRLGQFFGKSITAATREYLKAKGEAATVDEIIEGLKKGGCDLGTSPLRNVKISLSKNSRMFATVGEDVFGLWEFYPGKRPKKAEAAASEAGLEEEEETEAGNGEKQAAG